MRSACEGAEMRALHKTLEPISTTALPNVLYEWLLPKLASKAAAA